MDCIARASEPEQLAPPRWPRASAPFSLEDCITITFNGPGFVSFDAGVFRGVPDSGATAVLLGIGLLAIGGAAKFRKAKVTV